MIHLPYFPLIKPLRPELLCCVMNCNFCIYYSWNFFPHVSLPYLAISFLTSPWYFAKSIGIKNKGLLTLQKWYQIYKVSILCVSFEIAQQYAVVLVELHVLVCEIKIYHILEWPVHVWQIFDVLAVLQQGVFSSVSALDHLEFWIKGLTNLIDVPWFSHAENYQLILARHSLQESGETRPLEHLHANSQLELLVD